MNEPSAVRRRAKFVVFLILAVLVLAVVATVVVGVLTAPRAEPVPNSDNVLAEEVPCRLQNACSSS